MIRNVYRYLVSMKAGLILVFLIGFFAAIGSVFFPYAFYDTVFFKILLLLLLGNMALCTIDRFKRFKNSLKNNIGTHGWLRQIGMLILHAGIVLILAGGFIFAYYGQSEQMQIIKGRTADVSSLIKIKKPFLIQLDDFRMTFNKDGSVSQYYSYIRIIDDGKSSRQSVISVNHPLNYKGIKFYQMNFGNLIRVKYTDIQGNEKDILCHEGDILSIQGTNRVIKIYQYIPSFNSLQAMESETMRPDNPQVIFSVYENQKLISVGNAKIRELVKVDGEACIEFTGITPYTVLQLRSDPGLPLTGVGGCLFMLGVCLALLPCPQNKPSEF